MKIPIDQIIVTKNNPRETFDEEKLRNLGESIKAHGQLQAIAIRKSGSKYELITGERRLRASVLVGLDTIEADVLDVDEGTAMELRLIENTQREDLSDAEKGDAVLALWALGKYDTIKEVADVIKIPYNTIEQQWIPKAKKLSQKVRVIVGYNTGFSEEHARYILKYPHSTQEKFAKVSIKNKLTKRQLIELTKLYDAEPNEDLDKLAKKTLGVVMVEVPKSLVSPALQAQMEERRQLAKIHRAPRKKPSKPITKEEVKQKQGKKVDFRFVKAKVTRGSGNAPSLKQEVKPTIMPNPVTPDFNAHCQCATCQMFAKHCKGRCWA